MIKIARVPLPPALADQLTVRTAQLRAANTVTARRAWQSARRERHGIREQLGQMAPGIERCMYCGDSRGTDIDHFEPIKERPAGTFEWPNHLLACSYCNSNRKRDLFPRDAGGLALLIDPTADDPVLHLRLVLRTGTYFPLSPQGSATIEVFGLNLRGLPRGRANAFEVAKAALCRAHDLLGRGLLTETVDCLLALIEQPHASVLQEMLRSAPAPGATDVLGTDVVAALAALDTTLRRLPGQLPASGGSAGRATASGGSAVVAM
jgi:hypothetical protein